MKGLHQNKSLQNIGEQGSSALGTFCCLVLAFIVILWLCNDTLQQSNRELHIRASGQEVDILAWLGLK